MFNNSAMICLSLLIKKKATCLDSTIFFNITLSGSTLCEEPKATTLTPTVWYYSHKSGWWSLWWTTTFNHQYVNLCRTTKTYSEKRTPLHSVQMVLIMKPIMILLSSSSTWDRFFIILLCSWRNMMCRSIYRQHPLKWSLNEHFTELQLVASLSSLRWSQLLWCSMYPTSLGMKKIWQKCQVNLSCELMS